MRPKYQIFVSSTYEDLKNEREIAIKAILELGHIPVGMEMFSAGDEQQWEMIKRQIDDSDYYVVILAHRYGSMDGAVSYTEKEYDYAVANRIPTLGFVIDKTASWPPNFIDNEASAKSALERFKDKVKKKVVSFWSTADDLQSKVSISISKAITIYPMPGWVRATTSVAPEVANELSRLSRENAELRSKNDLADSLKEEQLKDEAAKVLSLLKGNTQTTSVMYYGENIWTPGKPISLYNLFEYVAPLILTESSAPQLALYLATIVKKDQDREIRPSWPFPVNQLSQIMAYFKALGLVVPSKKKHAVTDKDDYWSLTAKGEQIYAEALIKELEAGSLATKKKEGEGNHK